jgi:hypothetical protein
MYLAAASAQDRRKSAGIAILTATGLPSRVQGSNFRICGDLTLLGRARGQRLRDGDIPCVPPPVPTIRFPRLSTGSRRPAVSSCVPVPRIGDRRLAGASRAPWIPACAGRCPVSGPVGVRILWDPRAGSGVCLNRESLRTHSQALFETVGQNGFRDRVGLKNFQYIRRRPATVTMTSLQSHRRERRG